MLYLTLTSHQCEDKDLVHRLSGFKQYPVTGQLYIRDQWQQEEVYCNKKNVGEVEDEEEQEEQVRLNGKHSDATLSTSPCFGDTIICF